MDEPTPFEVLGYDWSDARGLIVLANTVVGDEGRRRWLYGIAVAMIRRLPGPEWDHLIQSQMDPIVCRRMLPDLERILTESMFT
jgi:hypothetical protein